MSNNILIKLIFFLIQLFILFACHHKSQTEELNLDKATKYLLDSTLAHVQLHSYTFDTTYGGNVNFESEPKVKAWTKTFDSLGLKFGMIAIVDDTNSEDYSDAMLYIFRIDDGDWLYMDKKEFNTYESEFGLNDFKDINFDGIPEAVFSSTAKASRIIVNYNFYKYDFKNNKFGKLLLEESSAGDYLIDKQKKELVFSTDGGNFDESEKRVLQWKGNKTFIARSIEKCIKDTFYIYKGGKQSWNIPPDKHAYWNDMVSEDDVHVGDTVSSYYNLSEYIYKNDSLILIQNQILFEKEAHYFYEKWE